MVYLGPSFVYIFSVEVWLNFNIFKLQYPMDPMSSLYIMSALAHQTYIPYPSGHSEKSSIILFREICFLTSVVVQWLCLLTLKG